MKSVLMCSVPGGWGPAVEFWVLCPPSENFGQASQESAAASWPGLRDMKGFGVEASRGKSEVHSNQRSERTGRGRTVQKDDTNHVSHRGELWTATELRLRGRSGEGDKERAMSQSQRPRKGTCLLEEPSPHRSRAGCVGYSAGFRLSSRPGLRPATNA